MARPVSMMSTALAAAAASGLLPYLAPRLPAISPTNSGAPTLSSSSPSGSVTTTVVTPSSTPSSNPPISGSGVTLERPSSSQPISFEWGNSSPWLQLNFRNDSDVLQHVALDITVQDRLGATSRPRLREASAPKMLAQTVSGDIQPFLYWRPRVSFEAPERLHLPAVGFLRLRSASMAKDGNDHSGTEHSLLIRGVNIPEKPVPGWAGGIFVVSLTSSVIILLITGFRLRRKNVGLLWPMGGSNWSFQQSWGTNVTIASGLLGTLLTTFIFPEHARFMPRGSYTLLQSLFSALTILAPLLYGLIRRRSIENQGYVVMFLISGGIILWGALGQAATLFLLIRELIAGNTIDILIGRIMQWLAGILTLLLIFYGLRALYETAKGLSVNPDTGRRLERPRSLPPHRALLFVNGPCSERVPGRIFSLHHASWASQGLPRPRSRTPLGVPDESLSS
jgi:hypothetical protein